MQTASRMYRPRGRGKLRGLMARCNHHMPACSKVRRCRPHTGLGRVRTDFAQTRGSQSSGNTSTRCSHRTSTDDLHVPTSHDSSNHG